MVGRGRVSARARRSGVMANPRRGASRAQRLARRTARRRIRMRQASSVRYSAIVVVPGGWNHLSRTCAISTRRPPPVDRPDILPAVDPARLGRNVHVELPCRWCRSNAPSPTSNPFHVRTHAVRHRVGRPSTRAACLAFFRALHTLSCFFRRAGSIPYIPATRPSARPEPPTAAPTWRHRCVVVRRTQGHHPTRPRLDHLGGCRRDTRRARSEDRSPRRRRHT